MENLTDRKPKLFWMSAIIFILFSVFNIGMLLSSSFSTLSLSIGYFWIVVTSILGGFLTVYFTHKKINSTKNFLRRPLIISILSSIPIFITLKILKILRTQTKAMVYAGSGFGAEGLLAMFGRSPEPFLSVILILICFNIIPVISYLKKKNSVNLLESNY